MTNIKKHDIFRYCISGNIQKTYDLISDLAGSNSDFLLLKEKYDKRFFSSQTDDYSNDGLINEILNAYTNYFKMVLKSDQSDNESCIELLKDLICHILNLNQKQETIESCEKQLQNLFSLQGYYFLGGRTVPHYGPYIWKTQWEKDYKIIVPLGEEQVNVYFLDDFILKSWLDYATFSNISTGGWANNEGLFCIWDRYKNHISSPEFLVSFLMHEAQHINDYRLFPSLTGEDLEYRAKLVELINYPDNSKLLQFISDSNPDIKTENSHITATNKIINNLSLYFFKTEFILESKLWATVEYNKIKDYSQFLFSEDTKRLKD